MAYMNNDIHNFIWNVITYPGPILNGSLVQAPFQDDDNRKIVSLQHLTAIDAYYYKCILSNVGHWETNERQWAE